MKTMTTNKCKHYDAENGWCKLFTDWQDDMPNVEYCIEGPCSHYEEKSHHIMVDVKYNIGDTVWFANCFDGEFFPRKYSGYVYEIDVEKTTAVQKIYYRLLVNYPTFKEFERHEENRCFGTFEECALWCDKQNGKEKKYDTNTNSPGYYAGNQQIC